MSLVDVRAVDCNARSSLVDGGSVPSTREVYAIDLGLAGDRIFELAGSLPPAPRLAIVGSRAAHRSRRVIVPSLVEGAQRAGWSIVSGGALGIDGDAHRAALAHDVPQLAVVPCGSDRPYPPAHESLFESIAARSHSGILFAQRRGTLPHRAMFASRNVLVVGLSAAVMVVEAQIPSGTLITAEAARRACLPLGALVGSPGTAKLIARGAFSVEGDDAASRVERWLHAVARGEPPEGPATTPWPTHLQSLAELFRTQGPSGVAMDQIAESPTGFGDILEAEGLGLVIEVSAGRYVAVRPPAGDE